MVRKVARVEKVLAALAAGAFVVRPEWVNACVAAKRLLLLERYEMSEGSAGSLDEGALAHTCSLAV